MVKISKKSYQLFGGYTAREIENAIYIKKFNTISAQKEKALNDNAQKAAEKFIANMKKIKGVDFVEDMIAMGAHVELITTEKIKIENDGINIGDVQDEKLRIFYNGNDYVTEYENLNKKTGYDIINEFFGDVRHEKTKSIIDFLNQNY